MHRTTARFWKCFDKLPIPIKNVARQNFELLKSNPAIHRFILKRSVIFGQQELDSTIGHLLLKMATISYGFGLALTTNMTGWSKKAKKVCRV